MNHETTADEIIENLLLKASCWRQEAKRFAGSSAEAKVCLEHARDAETLGELERLRKLDELGALPRYSWRGGATKRASARRYGGARQNFEKWRMALLQSLDVLLVAWIALQLPLVALI